MSDLLSRRLALLSSPSHRHLLREGLRGIEREGLRVDSKGQLAHTPHPAALGSALTHEKITTDYSESLLEFITPAKPDIAEVLACLEDIHSFALSRLEDESLWGMSMPCTLPAEEDIPIAEYGSSHIGMIKHVYRQGLAVRYGRKMQCIAGLHYNFSLSAGLWELLCREEGCTLSPQEAQSERYIALIRNFRRYSWLLMYLFGASPVLSSSFLANEEHRLEVLGDDTLYLPYATSLRMSDLGYQNNAQSGIMPDYNHINSYIRYLSHAVNQPYPAYEAIGTKRDGKWIQLNTNILQIENEYYSSIRPKCVARSGERPVQALASRGVQYVEVRCLDIDPFSTVGITIETARFLDVFLHYIALQDSPMTSEAEGQENAGNFAKVTTQGRLPDLMLSRQGQEVSLQQWGLELMRAMAPVAALLDEANGSNAYGQTLAAQKEKLDDVSKTLSARVLAAVKETGHSFQTFALQRSREMSDALRKHPLPAAREQELIDMAATSLQRQKDIEAADTGSFDDFVVAYNKAVPDVA